MSALINHITLVKRFSYTYSIVSYTYIHVYVYFSEEESVFKSCLDKKYTILNTLLTEEKLGKIGDKLEHLSCKSLTQLAQQALVSTTVALRPTKKLHMLPFKISFKQLKKLIGANTFFCGLYLQCC
jgi:hypothetical protein